MTRVKWPRRISRGFSLVELVIVVVVIAVISAIAVRRMGRSVEAADESAFFRNLAALRRAIDHYHAEHDRYPTVLDLRNQLTRYTDAAGATSKVKTDVFRFGPYLRGVPPATVGPNGDRTRVDAADGSGVGRLYDETNGSIRANTAPDVMDAGGTAYRDY